MQHKPLLYPDAVALFIYSAYTAKLDRSYVIIKWCIIEIVASVAHCWSQLCIKSCTMRHVTQEAQTKRQTVFCTKNDIFFSLKHLIIASLIVPFFKYLLCFFHTLRHINEFTTEYHLLHLNDNRLMKPSFFDAFGSSSFQWWRCQNPDSPINMSFQSDRLFSLVFSCTVKKVSQAKGTQEFMSHD